MARCGDVGDDLGSRVLAARLVCELMRLAFLMERTYAPYSKWFGTAFSRLACGPVLVPVFRRVLQADDWKSREEPLSAAYALLAQMHNRLGVTEPLSTDMTFFYDRPYRVLNSERFVAALRDAVTDPAVRRLPPHFGSINQITDSTDILNDHDARSRFRAVYDCDL